MAFCRSPGWVFLPLHFFLRIDYTLFRVGRLRPRQAGSL